MVTLGDVLRAVRAEGLETPGAVARALGIEREAAERAVTELRAARLLRRGGRPARSPFGALARVARQAAGGLELVQPWRSERDEHAELLARIAG